jgi:hypothetical protein
MHILGTIASSITGSKLTAFESIETVSVGAGGTTTITFSSIPQTYAHLQVRAIARGTWVNAGGLVSWRLRMNGQSGAGYVSHQLYANAGGVGSYYTAISSGIELNDLPNNNAPSSNYGAIIMDILDYTKTNKHKVIRASYGRDFNTTSGHIGLISGVFLETPAVTSLTFFTGADGFAQNSSFALYGIKGGS